MDQLDPLLTTATGFWTLIQARFGVLLMTARLDQVAILLGIFLLAHLFRYFAGPRLHDWMRGLEGKPKWELRTLLLL
ncbi:mechanosensitive ion channel family protein, partial [Thioclava sp. BHET1]